MRRPFWFSLSIMIKQVTIFAGSAGAAKTCEHRSEASQDQTSASVDSFELYHTQIPRAENEDLLRNQSESLGKIKATMINNEKVTVFIYRKELFCYRLQDI